MRDEILNGRLLPTIIKLSGPIVAGNLLETAYEWAGLFWLGRLGPEAVAAVSISFPATFLLISVAIGFTIAGTTLVAQYTGAGDQRGVNKVAGQTVLLIGTIALVLSIAGHFSAPAILRILDAPPEIMPDALIYLRVFYWGLFPMFFFFLFQALLRGWGDTVTPMKLAALGVTLNIILDPFLIFGWGPFPAMGVAGAAYAIVFSRTVAALVAMYMVARGRFGIQITRQSLRPDFSLMRTIFRIGLPSTIETGNRSLDLAVMTWLVAGFGANALAAYGIGSRIMSLVLMPSFAISAATTTMVGQNLGARQPDRASRSGWQAAGLVFGIFLVFGLLVSAAPQVLISFFNQDDQVLAIGSGFLRIVGPTFATLSAAIVLTGALRGAGDTFMAMIFALVSGWAIRIPLALLLVKVAGWGLHGIWWAMAIAHVLGLAMAGGWFRLGRWRRSLIARGNGSGPGPGQSHPPGPGAMPGRGGQQGGETETAGQPAMQPK